MKKLALFVLAGAAALSLSGCLSPAGSTSQEQITYAKGISKETLAELYKDQPEAKLKIQNSKGYIVYQAYAVDLFFLPTENGWGIATNNSTGETTIIRVINVGMGPGLGVAQMRNIFVFDNEIEFNSFAKSGWTIDAKASAVARFSQEGNATAAAEGNILPGVKVYKIGERGLILQADIDVSYSWKNSSLNSVK